MCTISNVVWCPILPLNSEVIELHSAWIVPHHWHRGVCAGRISNDDDLCRPVAKIHCIYFGGEENEFRMEKFRGLSISLVVWMTAVRWNNIKVKISSVESLFVVWCAWYPKIDSCHSLMCEWTWRHKMQTENLIVGKNISSRTHVARTVCPMQSIVST